MKQRSLLAVIAVLALAGTAMAEAQPQSTTQVYSLGEVVVSAGMPAENVVPTLEITETDIENQNADTLDKALELLPGVDVSKGAAGIPRVNIRGFRSRHTLLLLNGIPVNSTYDGQFNPNLVPTENIAKIKVSYGTHSVLYGQGGLAGVINIITKQGTQGTHGDALVQLDDRANTTARASISGANDTLDYFVGVSAKETDGFSLSDDFDPTDNENGGVRGNADDRRQSIFGNIGFRPWKDVTIGWTLERSTGEYGTPPITLDNKKDLFYKKPKYERTEDFDTFSTQVSAAWHPDGMLSLRAWAFVNQQEEDKAGYDNNKYNSQKKKNSYTRTDETDIYGGTVQAGLDFKDRGMLTFALSAQTDEYTSDGKKVLKDKADPTPFSHDHDMDLWSAGLEYRVSPVADLDLMTGYTHHWQGRDQGTDDDKGSYMVGASFRFTESTSVRASYARKIRFPSIRQLYDADSGNADLKPEQSDNWEAGITQSLFWGMTADLTLFFYDVEHYIEKNDATDLFENNDAYEFKGVDICIKKPFLKTGTIGLGYSYLETEDKSPGTMKDELQYRPRHKFTATADYTWGFGLKAYADLMMVTDQYYYSSKFDKGKLDDYTVVNIRVEQPLVKERLSIFAGVTNLFDENYEESYGFPQPGQTWYAGAKFQF